MNLLVVAGTYIFPHSPTSTRGIFFGNFLRHLRPLVRRIVAVVPAAYVPSPLLRLRRFDRQRLPLRQGYHGVEVYRPRYLSFRATRHLWMQSRMHALGALPTICRLHREDPFDLVLGKSLGQCAHTAVVAARTIGRPCVTWAIGSDVHTQPGDSSENARLLRHNVLYSDLVLTVSDRLRRTLLAWALRAPYIRTFYRGIDLEGLTGPADRAALRRALGLLPDRTYMLSAGAANVGKGVREWYGAFRLLSRRRPGLSAVWVGGGPESGRMLADARRDGLGERVIVTGMVPRPRAMEYMRACDVMAFASHAEGLPNVVMEAMAAGLPTVSTAVGGVGELIAGGINGLIVPPRSAEALAAAVDRLLSEPDRAAEMGASARRYICRYFDVRRNVRAARDLFKKVAEHGRITGPLAPCDGVAPGELPIDTLAAPAAPLPRNSVDELPRIRTIVQGTGKCGR